MQWRVFLTLRCSRTVVGVIGGFALGVAGFVYQTVLMVPHGARLVTKNNRIGTMLLSGILGGILLCGAEILARSAATTELPVSIFTSLLGASFLIFLIVRERRTV